LIVIVFLSFIHYSPILEAPGYNPVLGRGVDGFHHGVLGPPKELFLKIFSKVFKSETLSYVFLFSPYFFYFIFFFFLSNSQIELYKHLKKLMRELNQLNSKRGSQELPEAFVESKILLVALSSLFLSFSFPFLDLLCSF